MPRVSITRVVTITATSNPVIANEDELPIELAVEADLDCAIRSALHAFEVHLGANRACGGQIRRWKIDVSNGVRRLDFPSTLPIFLQEFDDVA